MVEITKTFVDDGVVIRIYGRKDGVQRVLAPIPLLEPAPHDFDHN